MTKRIVTSSKQMNKTANEETEKRKSSREAWEEAANEVWNASAKQLSLSLRYLFVAFGSLKKKSDPRFTFTATDGENLYYNPMKLVEKSLQGQVYINRAAMHSLMHCIFPSIQKASNFNDEELTLWNIASDILAEYIIDGMQTQSLMLPESDVREQAYKKLTAECGILSVDNIFSYLHKENAKTIALWEELFFVDDHSLWRQSADRDNDAWKKQCASIIGNLPAYGRGKGGERLLKALNLASKKHISYSDFLKKFMNLHELSKIDPDSFDYGYYNYGLELYGDMPLIEETETREGQTIEEIIIVIDTSGSCAGGLSQRFLSETLMLLKDLYDISGKTRVRLLQCDREIVSDTIIDPYANVEAVIENAQLRGFGGTDFREPFKYARELKNRGRRITAMIYFTDGYGLYPVSKPPWKTAFIFPEEPDFDDEERLRLAAASLSKENEPALLRPPVWALTHALQ